MTFAALFVSEKRDKRKVSFCFFTAAASHTLSRRRRPRLLRKSVNSRPTANPSPVNSQKIRLSLSSAFSFAYAGAKEKAIKKKTPK